MAGNSKNSALLALALGSATLLPTGPALAQSQSLLHAGSVDVPLNKSQVVSADRPIARAMVGNAEIADVLPITDRSIYVLGKKMGTTSLTLYGAGGRVLSIMDIAVGPDVIALEDQLHQVVPGEKIEARISNKSIVLTGTVNTAGAADRAAQLAKAYVDDKDGGTVVNLIGMGSSQQVMLEVRFAEVERKNNTDLGVKFSALSRNGRFEGITGSGSGFDPSTGLTSTAITGAFTVLRKTFGIGNTDITAMINALEARGLAKTLAQPTLVALSGEKASFLAGGEFPVPVSQNGLNGGSAITVEFKPFGISLAFTPTILGDKTISMIVEPEVSAIDNSISLKTGDIEIPGLRTRRASTTLELRDGESFAIAGLLSKDFETAVEQIPLLSSIPVLGALFRSTSFKKGETELLIVVTPRLVQPIRPDQVRLPTDRVLDPREADTFLMGQAYRPQQVAPSVPAAPASPQAQAAPATPDATSPATAELSAQKKDDGYAY